MYKNLKEPRKRKCSVSSDVARLVNASASIFRRHSQLELVGATKAGMRYILRKGEPKKKASFGLAAKLQEKYRRINEAEGGPYHQECA